MTDDANRRERRFSSSERGQDANDRRRYSPRTRFSSWERGWDANDRALGERLYSEPFDDRISGGTLMGRELSAAATARAMTEAAKAFLPTLSPELRGQASFDFESDERRKWHYIPKVRGGVKRGQMDGAQLEAADALMASGLSRVGFEKARAIIAHESILGRVEALEGGSRFDRDPGLYYQAVFGDPSSGAPWGWRAEGHHLSLNYAVVDGEMVASTPSFFGANPAEVKSGPETGLRILKDEEDAARELLLSLDAEQRESAAIYPVTPSDIITRASARVEIGEAAGLPGESMTSDQRETLVRLIRLYVDKQSAELAANAMARIESAGGIGAVHFAWAGSQHRGQPHYYRLHGPTFFVEYDNIQNMANHVHSVWRDPEHDFGFDLLKAHYKRHHAS